jgi:hypothetical protein
MAVNLKKVKARVQSNFDGGVSNSWSDFYLNMALEMAENVAKTKTITGLANRGVFDFTGDSESIKNINDNFWFAQSLTEEYDKVVRGGKTLFYGGGVPVSFGNKVGMQASLISILQSTQLNKNGDLLRDIGPAIQTYWTGANLEKYPPPKQPCIGAILNTSTILGVNFSPGIWTPISIPPMDSVSPWLLNFIVSASVHLLTVGGIFTCICNYPPPAPPAPGVLPWAGYYIKPFSGNPIKSLDFKDMVSLAGGTVLNPFLDSFAEGQGANTTISEADLSVSNLAQQLTKGFIEGSQSQVDKDFQAALQSIIKGDEPAMAAAGENIRNNRG